MYIEENHDCDQEVSTYSFTFYNNNFYYIPDKALAELNIQTNAEEDEKAKKKREKKMKQKQKALEEETKPDKPKEEEKDKNEDEEPNEEGGKKGNKKKKAAEDDKVRKLSFRVKIYGKACKILFATRINSI